jgi:hypothetical protein
LGDIQSGDIQSGGIMPLYRFVGQTSLIDISGNRSWFVREQILLKGSV